ncbi:U3 small nucleolar ribonucleoprotein protein IMP4-like [Xenia sp. Carnegie-2017]|uniref:U3 small nucleolar ribonucleoprotein protein IMP4-like n=1 Tax=Xenia sp. Carnegie-2017 TaxID=2897299 RepID=UPI001F037A11|nr:U3 small nucleolar ribonucleoprotein protein IMP4-like [Xenia sp. Carnegie-2017]
MSSHFSKKWLQLAWKGIEDQHFQVQHPNYKLLNLKTITFQDGLVVCHLPYGPTVYFTLSNTVMGHDIPNIGIMSEVYPHLIFHKCSSKLGERVKNILKYLFPVPKDESKRVVTFDNQDDYISFRHHSYKRVDGNIELSEIGPRFEMKVYEIRLGTVDQSEADVELRLTPYMNTSKKRKFLE